LYFFCSRGFKRFSSQEKIRVVIFGLQGVVTPLRVKKL